MNNLRLNELFRRYYTRQATTQEKQELMQLLVNTEEHEVADLIASCGHEAYDVQPVLTESAAKDILEKILNPAPVIPVTGKPRTSKTMLIRLLLAASIVLVAAAGIWYSFFNSSSESTNDQQLAATPAPISAPDANRAVITLADGRKVYLDQVADGTLAVEGDVQVRKLESGEIEYKGAESGQVVYNTLYNPRGSRVINLILADGSKVWLNSESTLRYPSSFPATGRQVEVAGEAYFEITPEKNRTFSVAYQTPAGKQEVRVLGTSFNIQAYADDPQTTATLLEGQVEISGAGQTIRLKPGEQVVSGIGSMELVSDVNTAEVTAWKDGYFHFNSADIETILRQTARWYDIETEYQGKIPTDRYSGKISRDVNLSDFLKMLEYSEVHFRVEGRKIIVLP